MSETGAVANLVWQSPTGKPPRGGDGWGSGAFGAPRGGRPHYGVDYICEPGQAVVIPCDGQVTRIAKPYANDLKWLGLRIDAGPVEVTMFYLEPEVVLGRSYKRGDQIGVAQDISKKYQNPAKGPMTPHIHAEVRLKPGQRMTPGWKLGVDFLFRPTYGTYLNPMRVFRAGTAS